MTRADALRALADGKMIRAVGRDVVYRLDQDGLKADFGNGFEPAFYGFSCAPYEIITEVEIKTTLVE